MWVFGWVLRRPTLPQSHRRRYPKSDVTLQRRDVSLHGGSRRRSLRKNFVTIMISATKTLSPLRHHATIPTPQPQTGGILSCITWPSNAAILAVLMITPRWPSSSAWFSTILKFTRVHACMRERKATYWELKTNRSVTKISKERRPTQALSRLDPRPNYLVLQRQHVDTTLALQGLRIFGAGAVCMLHSEAKGSSASEKVIMHIRALRTSATCKQQSTYIAGAAKNTCTIQGTGTLLGIEFL